MCLPVQETGYDSPAVVDRYAAMRERGLSDREADAVDRFLDPGDRVLDLGCGAGRTTGPLREAGLDVVAADLSRPMVASADDAVSGCSFAVADAASLPFGDRAFDAVLFSYNGIDELRPASSRAAALAEIRRVLVPGGTLAFSTRNRLRWFVPYPPTRGMLSWILRFWRVNLLEGNVGGPYKRDVRSDPPKRVYFSGPRKQPRQLRAAGFEPVARLGKGGPLSALFGPALFVVARRPPLGRSTRC